MKTIKQLLICCTFTLLSGAMYAQSNLILYGTVKDAATQNPLPNYNVYVIDSNQQGGIGGMNTVLTNSTGWYTDTLNLTGSGNIVVLVADCNSTWVDTTFSYAPSSPTYWSVTKNFEICAPATNCNYSINASPTTVNPLHIQFGSTFMPNPGVTPTYLWNFGDGSTDTSATPNHLYAQPGTYVYCLQVDNCPATCDTMVVGNSSAMCDASFWQSDSGLVGFVMPNATGTPGTFIISWGDGGKDTVSAMATPFVPYAHTYAQAGNYQICVEHFDAWVNPTCYDIYCDSISVAPLNLLTCTAGFIIDTVNSQTNNVVVWNTSSVNNAAGVTVDFLWDFGDGSTSTMAYPLHNYANPGMYQVCLTISAINSATGDNCTSTFCDSLGVDQNGNVIYKGSSTGWVLTVFDPNSIGVEENALDGINVYPNPANQTLSISLQNSGVAKASVELYSISGSLVKTQQLNINTAANALDVSDLPNGVYILQMSAEGNNTVQKVIIQH